MGFADGGAVRLSVYEGGGASEGGLSVGEGLEDMACEVSCVCLLFAGVWCLLVCRVANTNTKIETGLDLFYLVEVNHLFLLVCFTAEEGGQVAAGGDCSAESKEFCLVAAL